MNYSTETYKGINNNTIDTEELKSNFNDYLYNKGYSFKQIDNYINEYFENLLTFKQNEKMFIKSLVK